MIAQLIIIDGDLAGQIYTIDEDKAISLGRTKENGVVFQQRIGFLHHGSFNCML